MGGPRLAAGCDLGVEGVAGNPVVLTTFGSFSPHDAAEIGLRRTGLETSMGQRALLIAAPFTWMREPTTSHGKSAESRVGK